MPSKTETCEDENLDVMAPVHAAAADVQEIFTPQPETQDVLSEKWSPRRTVFFVIGLCAVFWMLFAWFLFR